MALNMSGKWFNVVSTASSPGSIDYDAMEAKAREHKPKLIVAGASAYSLHIDWALCQNRQGNRRHLHGRHGPHWPDRRWRVPQPVPHAGGDLHHKSLRGPRGGII